VERCKEAVGMADTGGKKVNTLARGGQVGETLESRVGKAVLIESLELRKQHSREKIWVPLSDAQKNPP
jgi:hypothetical protein